ADHPAKASGGLSALGVFARARDARRHRPAEGVALQARPAPGADGMRREQALQFYASLEASGVRMGLERIERALLALDHPEREWRALHVAGTNGKGSTCAFAASCLAAQGYRVGLYTSPHLNRVNERIQISGQPISDALLANRIVEVLERYPDAAREPHPL